MSSNFRAHATYVLTCTQSIDLPLLLPNGDPSQENNRFDRLELRVVKAIRPCPVEFNSDGRAGDVRFRSIPTPTPPGGSYVGEMVVKGVSTDSIFNEDFGNVFKSAVGAVVCKLH